MAKKKCKAESCVKGWIHHQHPMKDPGVIMSSSPCKSCNADRKVEYTWPEGSEFAVTIEETSEKGSN